MSQPPYSPGLPPQPYQGGPVLGGLAYWRKNPFLAPSMEPILITLVNGWFRAVDRHGSLVLDAPAVEVSGSLGTMGTLKITARGRTLAVVGRGSKGGSESGHSPVQLQQLQAFYAQFPSAAAVRRGRAGPVDAVMNGSAAATMAVWRDGLAAAGAHVR